ncbi:hypothetical protein M422DRAFT_272452 [Sphaerobolus stellatus SS14]|uniref:Uncharacterized protein n=1 Tax=Sphaerobolus stellatus (strain SS14) TaxID=990650 RepID=A0A0C9TXE3_SPHS4|nr:hypothetical protein M422DRAFT_272452 [Sphaerobolus stellatus SS14]
MQRNMSEGMCPSLGCNDHSTRSRRHISSNHATPSLSDIPFISHDVVQTNLSPIGSEDPQCQLPDQSDSITACTANHCNSTPQDYTLDNDASRYSRDQILWDERSPTLVAYNETNNGHAIPYYPTHAATSITHQGQAHPTLPRSDGCNGSVGCAPSFWAPFTRISHGPPLPIGESRPLQQPQTHVYFTSNADSNQYGTHNAGPYGGRSAVPDQYRGSDGNPDSQAHREGYFPLPYSRASTSNYAPMVIAGGINGLAVTTPEGVRGTYAEHNFPPLASMIHNQYHRDDFSDTTSPVPETGAWQFHQDPQDSISPSSEPPNAGGAVLQGSQSEEPAYTL